MSRIILDFGSGNTCKNDKAYIKRMYDKLAAVDTNRQHQIFIKWQLFKKAGENIPLTHECFDYAFEYGWKLGYQKRITASVFDQESLDFLLQYDPCFIKIANQRSLNYLIGKTPRKIPIVASVGNYEDLKVLKKDNTIELVCVSDYPAKFNDYTLKFMPCDLGYGISDHTTDFELFRKFEPEWIEWHYKLEDSTGLDAGDFARTPKMLKEIL